MAIELSREELFRQVWERPMTKLAADYGISDVALKKICTKHRIPVPGRGYWAKKAAGQRVPRMIFRPLSDPALNRIVIRGIYSSRLPPEIREAQASAKVRRPRPEDGIEVMDPPADPLPVVRQTKKKLLATKPNEKGLISLSDPALLDITISPGSIDRVVAFLDAFVRAAKRRGYQPVKSNRHLVFMVDDEPLAFAIVESFHRKAHALTESERATRDKLKTRSRQDRHIWKSGLSLLRFQNTIPKWDYFLTGKLLVKIDGSSHNWDGIRRTYGDAKTQKIETLIAAILDGLAACSAAIKAKRIEQERREIEREEQERRRLNARRQQALQKKRIDALLSDLERRKQRQEILDYMSAVEDRLKSAPENEIAAVREWVEWVRSYADSLDPIADGLPRLLQEDDENLGNHDKNPLSTTTTTPARAPAVSRGT